MKKPNKSKQYTKKEYCEFNCPLQDKGAAIEVEFNSLLAKLMCNYNEIDPACLKRFIAETLSQKGSLMLIELIEDNKIEKRANG